MKDSSHPPFDQAANGFLATLFAHLPPGHIEIRVIVDKPGGELVARRWYDNFHDAVDDLNELNHLAEQRNAAVFIGILPRLNRSSGESQNTGPGRCAWADIDFQDFKGGEAEARRRLAELPLKPSMIVCSGHGLHVYWLLREPTPPTELSALSKRIARFVGGDHAFDAARLLRLPGTWNRKSPENPILVTIESLDAERAYNPSEIEEALETVGSPTEEARSDGSPTKARPGNADGIRIGVALSPQIKALIVSKPRVRNLFNGEGKPESGEDGRTLDRTSSGYDYSFVMALAKRGVRDASDLATALWHRPDDAARSKGIGYVTRTVHAVLALLKETSASQGEVEIDFQVEKIRAFTSNPARYEFTVEGATFVVTSAQLLKRGTFAVRFTDALRRVPSLPEGADWTDLINEWLAGAEEVEMPPEASDESSLREDVEDLVEDLPLGEEAVDLDHGKAVLLPDGRRAFKSKTLHKLLREDRPGLPPSDVCRVLRNLGFESGSERVGGQTVRVWRRSPICAREEKQR